MKGLATCVVFLTLMSQIQAYSSGAPTIACRTNSNPMRNILMVPLGHNGLALERNSPKAKIDVEDKGDNVLRITLSSPDQFQGFLIVVQDKNEKQGGLPIGEFTLKENGVQGLRCSGTNSGVTHAYNSLRSSISVDWKKPTGFQGKNVIVRATMIYSYSVGDHTRTIFNF